MTTRLNGPGAGLDWLTNGFMVAFRHPKPLFGAAALLLVAAILPSLVTLPMQFHAMRSGIPQSPAMLGGIMAFSVLYHLLLVPLYAGYLRMVDALERGMPASAFGIFDPYRQGDAWRLIGLALANVGLQIVLLGAIIAAAGGGIISWYVQLLSAQAAHQQLPALPPGFGTAVALFIVLCLFMMGFYAISLGQVALRQRGVFGALGDGIVGALKNLLPLVVYALSFLLAGIVLLLGFVLVGMVLALMGKLVGAWLFLALMIPLYVALFLLLLATMFGVMYYLWRDVCGDGEAPDMEPATAV